MRLPDTEEINLVCPICGKEFTLDRRHEVHYPRSIHVLLGVLPQNDKGKYYKQERQTRWNRTLKS